MTDLFTPLAAGDLQLKNRIFMAPLTRGRAGESRVPNEMMAEYYAQRASAGLIISEATAISPMGYGWQHAPAIYSDDHMKGWRIVTKAVHEKGGKIILQLWHMGRVSHPDFLNGELPVAPSAIAAEGEARGLKGEKKPYVTPRAMTAEDITLTIQDYVRAARLAMDAGFDGVQIHGANGYLIDQFLKESSNQRSDQYGGSIPNRARFLLEVCEAVAGAIGAGRTSLRLSAINGYNSMNDAHLPELFEYVATQLNALELAFVELREPQDAQIATPVFRKAYRGILVGNDNYEKASANDAIASGRLDAIAFGRKFIANPDLVERFAADAPLSDADMTTAYSEGPKGYIDYASLPGTRAA